MEKRREGCCRARSRARAADEKERNDGVYSKYRDATKTEWVK